MQEISLAASVASRICHDLVSPVGAIVNGVDLVREMGAGEHAEAISMIGQSAERASALLQLYRIAFGTADADSQSVARGTLAEHSAVLFAPPRIALEWVGRQGPPLPRREARLLCLLLLAARSILGIRGAIVLRTTARSATPLSLEVMAESLSSSAEMLSLLEGKTDGDPISPRSVEFVLARDLARDLDIRLEVTRIEGCVTIRAEPGRQPMG